MKRIFGYITAFIFVLGISVFSTAAQEMTMMKKQPEMMSKKTTVSKRQKHTKHRKHYKRGQMKKTVKRATR